MTKDRQTFQEVRIHTSQCVRLEVPIHRLKLDKETGELGMVAEVLSPQPLGGHTHIHVHTHTHVTSRQPSAV